MALVGHHPYSGAEFKRLKIAPVLTERFETGPPELLGDELGGQFGALRAGQPAFQRIRSEITYFASQIRRPDFRRVPARAGARRPRGLQVSIGRALSAVPPVRQRND